jgi:hypothetical protein
VKIVPETVQSDGSGDSDDNVPVARLLRPKKKGSLTFQIKDCKDGPQGDKAIGVTVANTFDGVEFKGVVDSFRRISTRKQRRYDFEFTYISQYTTILIPTLIYLGSAGVRKRASL